MSADFIPEEKLLNLIKEQKEKSISEDKITLPADKFADLSSGIKKQGMNLSRELSVFINRRNIIIVSCAFFCLLALIYILYPKKNYQTAKSVEAPLVSGTGKITGDLYIDKIEGNIAPIKLESAVDNSEKLEVRNDLIDNLTLSGVIFGDNPQAIIFDKETLKTYYVSKGETIEDVRIEDVTDNRVVISYKDKNFELFL